MSHVTRKLLGIALNVWALQLLYVALCLTIIFVVVKTFNITSYHLHVQILCVVVMIIINVIWRIAIRRMKPEWF
jgi:hypothetical protein